MAYVTLSHLAAAMTKPWIVEFNVEVVQEFEWNAEAYENLVIPPDQKAVLTTLVEAHTSEPAAKVDDFVRGKGLGLVINLYGNPGTGTSYERICDF